jgi:hypothetical protein
LSVDEESLVSKRTTGRGARFRAAATEVTGGLQPSIGERFPEVLRKTRLGLVFEKSTDYDGSRSLCLRTH